MITSPEITTFPACYVAKIHLRIAVADIQKMMGPAIQEVFGAIGAQGLVPAGPWFAHHFVIPTDTFEFDVCVPVASPVQPTGRVLPGEIAAVKVARVVYSGAYEGLMGAWTAFHEVMKGVHERTTSQSFEVYAVGPETSPKPEDWRTELNWVLEG
jgi:effector-binding domain-containing protein